MNLAEHVIAQRADHVAVIDERRRVTYGELGAEAARVRGRLVAAGLGRGDRVALCLSNRVEFASCYLAVLGLGAVAVPMNPRDAAAALRHELAVTGCRALMSVDPLDLGALPGGCAALDADGRSWPAADASPMAYGSAGSPGEESSPVGIVDCAPHDPAVLVFTSGTAGTPKAATLTHGNLDFNYRQAEAHGEMVPTPDDVVLGVPPLFHVLGVHAVLGAGLRAGATVLLVDGFDPAAVGDLIVREGVTVVYGVPAMWQAWLDAGLEPATFATVRRVISGAARLDPGLARRAASELGLDLVEAYGLTEASALVTSGAGVDAPLGSIGVPVPGLELRLVDADGNDVLVGDPGEILLKGANVFAGYWADPEATESVLDDDGWLSTRDIAVVDDDGFLYLVDRAKDLIIVSGFNVSPAEVEQVLLEHPSVVDAAVVGRVDERTGEAVRAHVVLSVDVSDDDLKAHCGDRLARYKCPVEFVREPSLPRGPTGKVLRRILR